MLTKWQFDKSPHAVPWNNSTEKYPTTAKPRETQLDYFALLLLSGDG